MRRFLRWFRRWVEHFPVDPALPGCELPSTLCICRDNDLAPDPCPYQHRSKGSQ